MWDLGDLTGTRNRRAFRPFVKAARRAEEREALRLESVTAEALTANPIECCDGECYDCSPNDCGWCGDAYCRGCAANHSAGYRPPRIADVA